MSKRSSWEGSCGMWPVAMIQQVQVKLPPGFVAEPRVQLGAAGQANTAMTDIPIPPNR